MILRYVWIAVTVFILDQATKWLAMAYIGTHGVIKVMPFFDLVLVHNTGAAFGFLSQAGGWQNVFFVAVAIVISTVILVMTYRLSAKDKLLAVALMLVLGGALGNLVDRLRFGYVVDFLDVYYQAWHWPAFNVADSAITIGALLLILDAFGVRGQAHSMNSRRS
jgi:signal peptidase II